MFFVAFFFAFCEYENENEIVIVKKGSFLQVETWDERG